MGQWAALLYFPKRPIEAGLSRRQCQTRETGIAAIEVWAERHRDAIRGWTYAEFGVVRTRFGRRKRPEHFVGLPANRSPPGATEPHHSVRLAHGRNPTRRRESFGQTRPDGREILSLPRAGFRGGRAIPRRARLGLGRSANGRPDNRAWLSPPDSKEMRPRHLTPYLAMTGILALLASFALALFR